MEPDPGDTGAAASLVAAAAPESPEGPKRFRVEGDAGAQAVAGGSGGGASVAGTAVAAGAEVATGPGPHVSPHPLAGTGPPREPELFEEQPAQVERLGHPVLRWDAPEAVRRALGKKLARE